MMVVECLESAITSPQEGPVGGVSGGDRRFARASVAIEDAAHIPPNARCMA